MLDLSVVVPARNAAGFISECLASIIQEEPKEVIVVDGLSTDATVEIALGFGTRVMSDGGRGLPAARVMGATAAKCRHVALIDVDVVLPKNSLAKLLEEFERGHYTALQAGLDSVAGPGYWGQALANHHRTGRSRHWFGLVATIFDRDTLLKHGLDDRFLSGEDIELRWRLERAGVKCGVSKHVAVVHRFGDSFDFAKSQFQADGHGLGRMVVMKGGWKSLSLLALPAVAGIRGIFLTLVRLRPKWIPYYLAFVAFNYWAMLEEIGSSLRKQPSSRSQSPPGSP
ncbi:MAG: glycosyltransferase [Actinomycetota bacterium]|nr:glycosyltransferase [Actinomycetota bacterium]